MQDSFNKRKEKILEFNTALEELNLRKRYETSIPKEIPDDLIVKCPKCTKFILKDNFILDSDAFEETFGSLNFNFVI